MARGTNNFEIVDAALLWLVTANFGWTVLGLAFPLTKGRFPTVPSVVTA